MRCWRELGSPDDNCPATLANAKAAGMTTVVYFFPDAEMDPVTQVGIIMNSKYKFIFICI